MSESEYGVTPQQMLSITVNGRKVTNVKDVVNYEFNCLYFPKSILFRFKNFLVCNHSKFQC